MKADRLWPVVVGMVVLIAGAEALEVWARSRQPDVEHIAVGGDDLLADDAEEDADGVGGRLLELPPIAREHERARILARRGEMTTALELFAKLVSGHPESGGLRAEYGYWLLVAKEPKRAIVELEAAAEQEPDNAWIRYNLGVARAGLHRRAAAERDYRAALSLRPGYGPAELALGNTLRRRGAFDEARAVLSHAVQHGANEERARAYVALGRVELAAGQEAKASRDFDRAVERAPASVGLRLAIARAFLASDADTGAERAVKAAGDAALLAPDSAGAQYLLGRAFERQGDTRDATTSFQRAVRLDPDHERAHRRLLRLALAASDYPAARMHAEHLLRIDGDSPEHLFLAGLVASRAGELESARDSYRAAIERAGGDYAEAYYNLGLLEKKAGNLEAAIAAYERAVDSRPTYRAARNNLALTYRKAGRAREAEEMLRALANEYPRYAAAWLNLGDLLSDEERFDEAIACIERAIEVQPGYPAARLNLGVAYRRAGRVEEAISTYRDLVREHPRYASGWYNLGLALGAAGDEAAEDAYRRVHELQRDHLASLRQLSRIARRRGNQEEAIELAKRALDVDSSDTTTRLLLAELYREKGDRASCARHVAVAALHRPDDEDVVRLQTECRALRTALIQ